MNKRALINALGQLTAIVTVSVLTVIVVENTPAEYLIYGTIGLLLVLGLYLLYSTERDRLESLERIRQIRNS